MLERIFDMLGNKPKLGTGIAGGTFASGNIIRWIPDMSQINEVLQALAFLMTVLVALLTIISWFQKQRERKRHEKPD